MSGVAILPWNKPGHNALPRNEGMPLTLDLVDDIRLNFPAAERRIAALPGRRTVKKDAQAAWLLKAITCIDLTTLAGDDTASRVRRLCAKAMSPVRPDLLEALGMGDRRIMTGAICVYHRFVATAVAALEGSGIPVAAVSTGFPAGLVPHDVKLREIEASVADGAREIDIVITREYVLTQNWQALYDEMRDFRAACGDAHVKAILATGDLKTLRNVAKASMVCMMAGADFIKTSTGKETVNATLLVTLAMLRMIRDYHERHRIQGRLQAGRRHFDGEGRAQLSDPHEGGTWPRMARARSLPRRRVVAARRYRAPARTSCHRPVFGLQSPCGRIKNERRPLFRYDGLWPGARERRRSARLACASRQGLPPFHWRRVGQRQGRISTRSSPRPARCWRGSRKDRPRISIAAVKAARKAQPGWAKLGGHGRARHLYALARMIQRHARLFAVVESLDNGKTVRETRDLDVPLAARHFYHHAGWAQLQETEFARLSAGWRRGSDHSVEFPVSDAGLESGAGAGARQHGGAEARRIHLALGSAVRRTGRSRRACRRASSIS